MNLYLGGVAGGVCGGAATAHAERHVGAAVEHHVAAQHQAIVCPQAALRVVHLQVLPLRQDARGGGGGNWMGLLLLGGGPGGR